MPPRLSTRLSGVAVALSRRTAPIERPAVCLFCSLRRSTPTRPRLRRNHPPSRRYESTIATTAPANATIGGSQNPRQDLDDALVALQKHAANYVNLSRIQLAINGLRQPPGQEPIRVAVLGLVDSQGTPSSDTAKRIMSLLLADPLKGQQAWEKEVEAHDLARPMIIRVGAESLREETAGLTAPRGSLLREINVSSPGLDGHLVEFLLMESNPYDADGDEASADFEDSVLVPTVDIPSSSDGRFTPITAPVHKALLVSDGILGAAVLAAAPLASSGSTIHATVNIPEYKAKSVEDLKSLPFTPIDVSQATDGLGRIRNSVGEAMVYERQWFQSNLPLVKEWLVSDVLEASDGATKKPVRDLITSLLQNASNAIEREETNQLASTLAPATGPHSTAHLKTELNSWAQIAHTELQKSLDEAFASRRWRKLGWWKLFWRVDDVGHISTDILSQRFLPEAERNAIYLSGKLEEAGVSMLLQTAPELPRTDDTSKEPPKIPSPVPGTTGSTKPASTPGAALWPTSIPTARKYLQTETVPALQALSQRLVFQALSTSGLTTSLGALVYFGTLTTGIYEAGAVAALGIVWSLRRLQKKWETARLFWEGEVREEGRKALKNSEVVFGKALDSSARAESGAERGSQEELERAKALVRRATDALERLK